VKVPKRILNTVEGGQDISIPRTITTTTTRRPKKLPNPAKLPIPTQQRTQAHHILSENYPPPLEEAISKGRYSHAHYTREEIYLYIYI
jgi:hypothetical protein